MCRNGRSGLRSARARRFIADEQPGQSARTARRGFTLFEVIIALSLTLLLLTAVYAAIRLQYRVSNSGRDQMERAQIARAVLRLMEDDIRSIVWQVQPPIESSADSAATQAADDTADDAADEATPADGASASAELLSTDEAFADASSGVFGDSQSLVLHISRPGRSLVYATTLEEEAAAMGRGDQMSVNYFLADSTAGGLAGAVGQQQGGGSSILGGVLGLARVEADRRSLEAAGATEAVETSAATAQILAPEVVSLEFSYWDGLEWLESWDSMASGTLPSAIGITLGIDTESTFEDRTATGQLRQSLTTGESANVGEPVLIRYVIAVPLAEPYVSEASL